MARDAYHELFVHLVWHTKEGRNLIPPDGEPMLHDAIRHRARQPGGVYVHEIGGTQNHVHLVARIPPTIMIAEWIGKIKGGSSHDVNHMDAWPGRMDWQSGYGLVSFGPKDLQWVIEYVRDQKQHHADGTIFERLEAVAGVPIG